MAARKGSNGSGERANVYDLITDKVVAQLESGKVPWRQAWSTASAPRSLNSGKPYRGLNVFLLLMEAVEKGYQSPWWLTYRQALARGGQVRKGEHGTMVIFWKLSRIDSNQPDGSTERKLIPMLRKYTVFNLDQVDGVTLTAGELAKAPTGAPVLLSEDDRNAAADAIVKGYPNGPRIRHDGMDPCYTPHADMIHLPRREQFTDAAEYYSTVFHELAHSTGHESRLDRPGMASEYGSHVYGREELVAEMCAAFLSAEVGELDKTLENSAAYLRGWIKIIREDTRAVVVAAGAAQRAADLILGRSADTGGDSESSTETADAGAETPAGGRGRATRGTRTPVPAGR